MKKGPANSLIIKIKTFSLFARDYLSLRDKPAILKLMAKYNDDLQNAQCYSDYMIRINSKENKEKRAILITRIHKIFLY